jgi:predicted DNA-binding protein (MmcQ/YjbR family)
MSAVITREWLLSYLLNKPDAKESFPFNESTSVLKVCNKMFALVGQHDGSMILNLKCKPDEAAWLCDTYGAITPGYHMDKKHWISIYFQLPDIEAPEMAQVTSLIDNSYMLIVDNLPKSQRDDILSKL